MRPCWPAGPEVLAALYRGVKFYSEREPTPNSRKRDLGAPWSRWKRHCRSHNTLAWRCDVAANTGVGLLGKTCEFALQATFLVAVALEVRPRCRHDRAAKPEGIMANLYAVRRLRDAEGFKMASLATAAQVIIGVTREYKDLYGGEALLPNRKEPFQRREVCSVSSTSPAA